ncbi:MAG TPA: ATP-binding protein [Vicinamibacteria bacterium]|nr:ATP-binding protein [Vicinamibacteria bacterium]
MKLGLRTKFFLYSNTVIAVTMSFVALLAVVYDRRRAYEAIESRGKSVTEALAIHLAEMLSRAERMPAEANLAYRYIGTIMARNQDLIRYVVVTDRGGAVTHASNRAAVGERLDWVSEAAQAATEVVTDGRAGRVVEARAPLDGPAGRLGWLAIGYSLAPIEHDLRTIAGRLVVMALLLMLGNSVVTAVYVEALIRPILSLHQIMKRAGGGDLTVRARSHRGDEVGELGAAFNRMMDELGQARALEQVRQTQLAHTEKMAAVGTLAAGVAHEVNNPLGGVLTCLENMRADPGNQAMRERYLALIQDGVERIERTVANLLDFSRQRPMLSEPTPINHSLRHVVELAAYQLRKAKIEVCFDLHGGEPMVMADHFQMEQLFLNLVLNALQAMPEGGTLTLRTRLVDSQVAAEVRDSGGGIPPEIRDRIFDPFFTTREVGQGTGLGLAVSDSIVASHGGRIEVESRVGAGSVFRVLLPRLDTPVGEGA